jgi:hypothetical protein
MPILESTLGTDGSGHPRIQLTYKINEFDHDPKIIWLKKMRPVGDFHSDRIPVYHSFDPGDPVGEPDASPPVPPRTPAVLIVAAPGVSVEIFNFPDHWIAGEAVPRLDVVRLQNPRMVPALGAPCSLSAMLEDYFVDTNPPTSLRRDTETPPPADEAPAEETGGGEEPPPEEDAAGAVAAEPSWPAWTRASREGPVLDVPFFNPPSAESAPRPADPSGAGDTEWSRQYAGVFDSRWATEDERNQYLFGLLPSLFADVIDRAEVDPMRLLEGDAPVQFTHEFLSSRSLVQVLHQPDGAIFTHPYSSQALFLEFPQLYSSRSLEERSDHNARFAYRINPPGTNPGGLDMPLVSIVKTSSVRATLTSIEHGIVVGRDPLRERVRRSLVFFSIHDTRFSNVPPQGAPLPVDGLRRCHIAFNPDPLLGIVQTFFDISIGLIPYVGDAVDIAEFLYALSTDRDRWGRRVSTLEKVVMGLGALIPLVGSGVMLAGPRLARAFGRGRQAAQRLERAVTAAHFTDEESAFLVEMEQRLARGEVMTAEQLVRSRELITRMPPCHA